MEHPMLAAIMATIFTGSLLSTLWFWIVLPVVDVVRRKG